MSLARESTIRCCHSLEDGTFKYWNLFNCCRVSDLFPGVYLSLFGLDEAFVKAGVPVIRLVAFAMLLMSLATIWLYALTRTGNSRMTLIIETAAILWYCIYVYVVLEVFQLSLFWGWMSGILYWSCLFTLSFFLNQAWQPAALGHLTILPGCWQFTNLARPIFQQGCCLAFNPCVIKGFGRNRRKGS